MYISQFPTRVSDFWMKQIFRLCASFPFPFPSPSPSLSLLNPPHPPPKKAKEAT